MPTGKEISLELPIQKLAIIAGRGTLPRDLYQRCHALGIECHVLGFKKHTDYITPDFWVNVGQSKKIIKYLNDNRIKNLVFIGGIDRPRVLSLRPDLFSLKFFFKAWLKSFGDSSLLTAARDLLEKLGFTLHGVHTFLPELLMQEGVLGSVSSDNISSDDIMLGVEAALELGTQDIGQAVIVKDSKIIAREDVKGTNAMIKQHGVEGAVLVKMCKPQQDPDMDLPTIGPQTVQLCADKKMAGIVGHAEQMLVVEESVTIALANQNNMFLLGMKDVSNA